MRLKIGLNGDQRLAENFVLEAKAVARSMGLEIESVQVENVQVASKPSPARKARKPASTRKPKVRP